MPRFSKALMVAALQRRVDLLAKQFDLDSNNGTAQLKDKGTDVQVAYGEFRCCLDLIEQIEGDYLQV